MTEHLKDGCVCRKLEAKQNNRKGLEDVYGHIQHRQTAGRLRSQRYLLMTEHLKDGCVCRKLEAKQNNRKGLEDVYGHIHHRQTAGRFAAVHVCRVPKAILTSRELTSCEAAHTHIVMSRYLM